MKDTLTAHRTTAGEHVNMQPSMAQNKDVPIQDLYWLCEAVAEVSPGTQPNALDVSTHDSSPGPHPNRPEADEMMRNADNLFPICLWPKVGPIKT